MLLPPLHPRGTPQQQQQQQQQKNQTIPSLSSNPSSQIAQSYDDDDTADEDCNTLSQAFSNFSVSTCCTNWWLKCEKGRIVKLDLAKGDYNYTRHFDIFSNLTGLQYLDLSGNSYNRDIPEFFWSKLTNLTFLDISQTWLVGELSESVGNLQKLQYLNLTNSNLRGNIPQSLGTLANLKRLQLQGNSFTGEIPETLGNLTNLEVLNLSHNGNLGGCIPASLANLTNLKELWLIDSSLKGNIPIEFNRLTFLKYFASESNPFDFMQKLRAQTIVDMNSMSGELPDLTGMTSLTLFSATRNYFKGSYPKFATNQTKSYIELNCYDDDQYARQKNKTDLFQRLPDECNSFYKSLETNPTPTGLPPATNTSFLSMVIGIPCAIVFTLLSVGIYFTFKKSQTDPEPTPASRSSTYKPPKKPPTIRSESLARANETCVDLEAEVTYDVTRSSTVGSEQPLERNRPARPAVDEPSGLFADIRNQPRISVVQKQLEAESSLFAQRPPMMVRGGSSFVGLVGGSGSSVGEGSSGPTIRLGEKAVYCNSPEVGEASRDILRWTTADVSAWLESVEMSPRVVSILSEKGVDGYQLFMLSDERLKALGIQTSTVRQIVLTAVDMLRNPNPESKDLSLERPPPQYCSEQS
ncbi:hypothetical protein HDU97_002714 [Phlyctochytrium planicorne]|nr:hypothetical protein HDU97_002714 [Phlyctochytrium planicorne]